MTYTGAMMEDLRWKGIVPEQDEAASRERMASAEKERDAKAKADASRRAHMRPEQIIVDVLRGEKRRAGPITERKAYAIAEALYRAGWQITKRPPGDPADE
jgi:hypothetical protein